MNTFSFAATRELPTGMVTFVFTDIEGSTPLYQHFPETMPRAMERHNEILSAAITRNHGTVFQVIGDAYSAAFAEPMDAVKATLEAQRELYREHWGEIGALRVRMGIHTGAAELRGGEYVSYLTLVRVQRLMNAGHGGQILLSAATAEPVRDELPNWVILRNLGEQKLKGLAQPEQIYQLVAADLPSEFPPLRVVETTDAKDPATLLEQLVRGRLVGREAELAQVRQHWNLAQQARAHMVLLSGEPGIGKTRLANELVAIARGEGATVLRGGCYEYEATTPYLPFVEAFRDWAHSQSSESLRTSLGETAPEIAKFAPEIESKLGTIKQNAPLPPNEERLRMFDTVARFLQRLAAAQGMVFFIDDLHWADQGTLNLLHYILRHLRNERLLILAAYREVELDRAHPLAAALVEWNREHLATRLSLARLSRGDTGTLLATLFGQASISDDFVGVLFRETEGNPFFIEEVVKSLIEQGEIYRENGGWGRKDVSELAIPQSVKEAIGRRLNRLSGDCIEVLRCAAALGKIFPFDELAAVVAAGEDQVLDALDEASAAQLIRANADDTFAFTHDKIREVLYEELNPIRRRRLHQRVGEKLEQLAKDVPTAQVRVQDLAFHFAQSGDMARVLQYSELAGQQATQLIALDEALRYYEQAYEAAETLQDRDKQAALAETIGDIYSMQGLPAPTVEHYERAIELARTTNKRGALHAKIGRDYAQVGDARGERYLELALAELDPVTQKNELALATAALGRFHHYHAQHHRALEYLEKALKIAEASDDVNTLNFLYLYLAGAYQHLLRLNESMAWAERAIELGERESYAVAIANGSEFLGEDAMIQGRWADALKYGKIDIEIGEKAGAIDRISWGNYIFSWSLRAMGELEKAEQHGEKAYEMGDMIGDERVAIMTLSMLAEIQAECGRFEDAMVTAQQAFARGEALEHIVIQSLTRQALARIYINQKEWHRASDVFQESLKLLAPSDNQWTRLMIGEMLAETYLHVGKTELALDTINEGLARAQFAGSPHSEGWSRRVKGQILMAQGHYDEAGRELDRAIEILEMTGSLLELARAYEQRGVLKRTMGDVGGAAADEERARELFIACGALVGGG